MPVTIRRSVGHKGENLRDDVVAVQTALVKLAAKLRLAAVSASGIADDRTVAAIIAVQRFAGLTMPDGRIDPGGRTLRALNAALPVEAAPAAPPASTTAPGLRTVTYHKDVAASVRIVSDYAIRVIERGLVAAGVKAAVITSTLRTPAEQARTMYGMASANLAAQFELYGATGDEVLKVFRDNRALPKDAVVELMRVRIEALHAQGRRVSLHVATPEAYAKLNIIDLGVNSTRAVAGATLDVAKLSAAFTRLKTQGYIREFIDETKKKNNCWHLEIVPDAKAL